MDAIDTVKNMIKQYHDFPKKGVVFYDIHPVITSPVHCEFIVRRLLEQYIGKRVEKVIGVESRGYYFGILLAKSLNVPFVPFRKRGKLPGELHEVTYGTEYSKETLCVQKDSIKEGDRVLIIDDLLVTGGTAEAAVKLAKKAKAELVGLHCHIQLVDLKGIEKLNGVPFHSLFQF
jgi:adenine phosphoribosyltransferase